jgi:carbon-monoxide dehydrogenase large subunit
MVAAPSAVHSAVLDALAHLGVRHVDMPCTPERVWLALREAGTSTSAHE